MRLNPFEIRGGLKLSAFLNMSQCLGLNPFEIRGDLKPTDPNDIDDDS